MFAIKERQRVVDDKIINTFQREVVSANILEVEAGTNGYHGGDSGHGSRTYIRIDSLADSDITAHITPNGGVELLIGGDCELETTIRALKFITKVLEDQAACILD